ncbi:MAG: amidohydrolase, partial [Actinomycetota bacterium]|nr:amidohydrolase [Actinomycetota bacterium]
SERAQCRRWHADARRRVDRRLGAIEDRLPIDLGPLTNGEYAPPPPTPFEREIVRRTREAVHTNARRTNVSRREFLRSACAMATMLLTVEGCSRERAAVDGKRPGGGFGSTLPPEATTEPEVASGALGREDGFVFDVQGHMLDFEVDPFSRRELGFTGNFPQASCGEADHAKCFDAEHFTDLVFKRSDTTMAVLSALPFAPEHSPLSPEVMDRTRRAVHTLCHATPERLFLHAEAHPTLAPLPVALAAMERAVDQHPVVGWKVYTHLPGPPWWLDDRDRSLPAVGDAFIRKAVELGVPRVAVHKGLAGGYTNDPADVGPAARRHPDVAFLVYHSGWEVGRREGPYSGTEPRGVDRLVASVEGAGIGRGSNVYAELGTTWFRVMREPDQAAHVLGKLLAHLGEDNVVWGTDSIWYGSPQPQIDAFRAFTISEEYQERFGYPALTDAVKAKVLGLSGARVYGVEEVRTACS